jgi:hypothetical protein
VKREERPARVDPATSSRMNGHEQANGEYEFTRKISNSFAESIMASSPTKANGAMGDGCDSGEGEPMEEEHLDLIQGDNLAACHPSGEKDQGEEHLEELSGHLGDNQALLQMEDELPQHPALLQCSSRKEGDSGFISPEQQGAGSNPATGDLLNAPNLLDFNRKDLGKTLDSSMDSDDVREDKDDEKEKEKPMMADMNEGYEYIAYDDTGCQEGIKEKKAPSPLLDFGEDCEVESQKLQDDRIGGEKDVTKNGSASSSSEDEAENGSGLMYSSKAC